jgi:hypothetical protein
MTIDRRSALRFGFGAAAAALCPLCRIGDARAAASEAQIMEFAQIFPMNARPLQPLNRRFLLQSGL